MSTHAYRMRVAGARQAVQWQPSVGSKKGSWPLTRKWAASSLSFTPKASLGPTDSGHVMAVISLLIRAIRQCRVAPHWARPNGVAS